MDLRQASMRSTCIRIAEFSSPGFLNTYKLITTESTKICLVPTSAVVRCAVEHVVDNFMTLTYA